MALGRALAAKVRPIVWCKSCGRRAEPDVADRVARDGPRLGGELSLQGRWSGVMPRPTILLGGGIPRCGCEQDFPVRWSRFEKLASAQRVGRAHRCAWAYIAQILYSRPSPSL